MWEYRGQKRPPFAESPGVGQESVWDYPRPPKAVRCDREIRVKVGDLEIARSTRTYRVLETASPPTFYIPPEDVQWERLTATAGSSVCEWKGVASYWVLASNPSGPAVAWSYAQPHFRFETLRGYASFYPALVECYVDAERARPQPGGFYGGWITSELVGPFKGAAGTSHW